jgi:hypothetical protein
VKRQKSALNNLYNMDVRVRYEVMKNDKHPGVSEVEWGEGIFI